MLLAALLLVASPARAQNAQGPTFNLQLFRPAVDSKGYFTVNASQLLGHLELSVGLVGTYAHDVLELHVPTANFRVSDLITAQLQGALGLFGWVELGVSLPVDILFGNRSDVTFGGQMVGDLGIHAKAKLWRRGGFGLAALTSLYVPTGQSEKFLGEGNVSLRPELIADYDFGRVRLALNAGALVRFDKHTFTDLGSPEPPAPGTGLSRSLGTQITYGVALSGAVVPGRFELLAELYGYADVTGSDKGQPLEWLAGGKVYLASKSYFQFGAGTGIVPDQTGSPEVRAFIGFLFEPPLGDRRGRGIRAEEDEEPPAPPRPKPEPERIADTVDDCTTEPEGCPDKTRAVVRRGHIQIFDKIYFETAKAIIRPESFPTLDAVAASLKQYPQIKLLEVQGHADERGDDDYNLRLTEDRAQAVRQYLYDRGIEPVRLSAHGYGETQPICREHKEVCWSTNRRVEFVIRLQDGDIPGQD